MSANEPLQAATGKLDDMAQHLAYLKLPERMGCHRLKSHIVHKIPSITYN